MSTDVYQHRSTGSKAAFPPGDQRLHQARLEHFKGSNHERYLKRESAPPSGVIESEFHVNFPRRQFSPVAIRSRSPTKYASLKRTEIESRLLEMRSSHVSARTAKEKPSIFNPEPVPFAAEKLRCSTVLKKVPLARQLKDGVPYGVYCSPALLCRTKGFVIRPGRQMLDVSSASGNPLISSESKPKDDGRQGLQVLPNKFKTPFFHASRALFADPPGSFVINRNESSSSYGNESLEKSMDVTLSEITKEQSILPPLNEVDDLLTPDVELLKTHERTSIYWPPPPPPVSTDVTMIASYKS